MILLTFFINGHPLPVTAAQQSLSPGMPALTVLPEVRVRSERITPTTGTTIIDREMIRDLPLGNGSVNEIIGIAPGVQFSEDALDSMTGGDITPPVVSISGSRFYDNNYTIDGLSNNSPLDPASDAVSDANKLPGHPQTHFLSPRLIDQITVYNSNIPAEFGGFTGGQVDARTLSPDPDAWGRINYRMTSDQWTRFHIHPDNREDFEESTSSRAQPDFTKHDFGLTFNLPVTRDTGVLASYQQISSRIQLQHLGTAKSETRQQDNFFLKLEHYLYDNSRLQLTALHTPVSTERFLRDFKNSDYQLDNDSTTFMLQWEKSFAAGQLTGLLGYTDQQRQRRSEFSDKYMWSPDTPAIDWSSGFAGSLGSLTTEQQELNIKMDFAVSPLRFGATHHQIKLGAAFSRSRQHYRRPERNYFYYLPVIDAGVECSAEDPACIPGEQYLSRRTVYNRAESRAEVNEHAAYLQDTIAWKRVELFPGLRISHDDFTDNTNLAPRLSLALDLFGNQNTVLFAGRNRYYSGTLLTQALYQAITTENQWRDSPGNTAEDWNSSVSFLYGGSDVKTPYTDEITVGLIQKIFGGELKLQYIEKDSRDEFARHRTEIPSSGADYYVLNNNGRSEHESIQVSWERSWGNHFILINGLWQKTNSSNTDYDSNYDLEDTRETIWYKGEELYPYEEPRLNFNRPAVINLIYTCKLPYQLTMTSRIKYRDAYWSLENVRDESGRPLKRESEINPGQESYVMEKEKVHSNITFDWHVGWRIPDLIRYNLVLTLDILNLFDRRSKITYPHQSYELGRQLWAGLEFNF